ncbi:leucine-rich repeat flightless-interacting protein 2 isoform X26 [Denticeps clupeoides]|uniref:leucine-rich repeat flightless-interacting protein 2 isoform X26 n=1 Tax=Denticeps clupeoides TaxID=299321 RepID=UPI0010A432B8|nr:leucine-rich repeat flightless-interacting protein 2-like isoform X26 [Denticeps clupeoides]
MGTQGTGRKRISNKERLTAEDDALNVIAREAEARLAAKRAARAEAREIRMKELERQQKEIYQVQKKYYGLDNKWGDIEQWMEESEKYTCHARRHASVSDDEERMSVGSRTSIRSDLDRAGVYGGASEGGSVSYSHKKSKKKKKKHKDRNGYDDLDDYSTFSSLSSRISDESRASRSSRPDLQQPGSYSDLYSSSSLPASRQPSASYNTSFQSSMMQSTASCLRKCRGSLYEDCTSSVPTRYSSSSTRGPSEYRSVLSSRSRTSSRASSACGSPADDDCSSVASFLRSAASSSGLLRDLDHVTIPDLYADDRLDRDYPEKGTSRASSLSTATLASLGGTSSRRGSADTAITADAEASIREIKEIHELKDQIQDVEAKYMQSLKEVKDAMVEVEDKYRKAMVSNAQLDNEKSNLMYQVDVLKDSLMELEELLSETRRECEDKTKELEREKHAHGILQFQFNELKETLKQSEELLNEIRQLRLKQDCFVREIADLQETVDWKNKKIGALERQKEYSDAIRNERDELRDEVVQLKDILKKHGIVLGPDLSTNGETGEALMDETSSTEGNSMLEIRLRKLVDERENLIEHVKRLKGQLEKKNQKNSMDEASSPDGEIMENGSDPNIMDVQRDASRQINDLKFKLVKSEQDVTALEQNVTRLEGQVTRYKSASENAEKIEDELKAEKRKLQRELRAALDKIEELEASNSHLSKRMEKMKSGRSTAQTPL